MTTGVLGSGWSLIVGGEPEATAATRALSTNSTTRLADITDGTSNTILLAEIAGKPAPVPHCTCVTSNAAARRTAERRLGQPV